eukprot:gene12049-15329_t
MKTQTIIVTGASTGIGKAIAGLFLEHGHNVVINGANKYNLQAAFEELGNHDRLVPVADVLVNNAGIFEPKPFLDVNEAYLDQFLNVNLKGTFFTSQAAIRQMLKQ